MWTTKGRQIGWVPQRLSQTVRKLQVSESQIRQVGTDEHGRWTKVQVDIFYYPTPASKEVDEIGLEQAALRDKTGVVGMLSGQALAGMPEADRRAAAEELEALAGAGLLKVKRRRRRSEGEGSGS